MKKIRKRFLFLFIFGCIVVLGIQLYVNSLDKKGIVSTTTHRGAYSANDLQPFTDLRPVRTIPRKFKQIKFKDKYDVLLTCSFDTLAEWPPKEELPDKFNPDEIIELGCDPGLGIRDLHKQGITGKGINVAIIDVTRPLIHNEYGNKIKKICLVNGKNLDTTESLDATKSLDATERPSMHGTATASLLVGERCGTAPGASLYFWGDEFGTDHTSEAVALEQILAFNKDKKPADRIRVVSMSFGLNPTYKNYKKFERALEEAKKNDITIVLVNKKIGGINCPLYKDRDNPANYTIMHDFQGYEDKLPDGMLYVPCESRTTASERGEKEYTYWGNGGLSWAVPYLAGVIAMGYQVNPNLESDDMYRYLRETGTPFNRGWIINPKKFIDKIKSTFK